MLNNLAYVLAVDLTHPAEGVGYAARAFTLAPGSPEVLDTYGVTQLLLGRSQEEVQLLSTAARLAPEASLIRLHAAMAFEAAGLLDAARRELDEAVRLDPATGERDEARALRLRLDRQP